MSRFSWSELNLVLGLLAAAIIIGVATQALGWCLFIATLVWIGVQAREYRKVRNWTRHPIRAPRNGFDSWFALAYRPFRSLNRQRGRTNAMASRLRELLALIEVIPDAVIVLNANGDIENLNQAAKGLLKLKDKDIGLGLASMVRNPAFVQFIRASEEYDPLEFSSPFEPDRNLEARKFAIDTGGVVVMIRDVTELNRLMTMRQTFVANVSHELRTPLTVVRGYLDTIVDKTEDDALRLSLVEKIPGPLGRMQSLVNDLLLLTTLESTPKSRDSDSVNLKRVAETVLQELQPTFASPDQVTLSANGKSRVCGVEKELHSVIANLVSNAIRHSPKGEPIEVSIGAHDHKIRLAVTDQGLGIAPEHLDRLTERFYRVDMAGARERGGTGLGLAIVKHVLRRHESFLEIESELGKGSRFFFDLDKSSAKQT